MEEDVCENEQGVPMEDEPQRGEKRKPGRDLDEELTRCEVPQRGEKRKPEEDLDEELQRCEEPKDSMWLSDVIAAIGPPWFDDITKQPTDEEQFLAGMRKEMDNFEKLKVLKESTFAEAAGHKLIGLR